MRAHGWMGVVVLFLLLTGVGVRADEPVGPADADRSKAMAELVGLLRLRIEARMKEGETLTKAGRLDEALEAFRSVQAMYDQGLKEIRALLDRLDRRPAVLEPAYSKDPAIPFVEFEETPEDTRRGWEELGGGAFRGRASSPERGKARNKRLDAAVDDALRWLAAHQAPSGAWEAAGFQRWCDGQAVTDRARQPDGIGKDPYDPGVTGLALCAFLGAGYTNRGKHPFAQVVARGLTYLKRIQDPEGCFGSRTDQHYVYNHAAASLAMVEAYGMTGSPLWKSSAQRALDFIALARNPYFAWRYGVRPGDNDTSVSGWMTMVLHSAQLINRAAVKAGRPAPLVIDESAFDGMKAWLEKVTDADYGRVGYVTRGTGPVRRQEMMDRFPADKSESLTALGVLSRAFMGENPRKSKIVKLGADLMVRLLPSWNPHDGSIDMYYWYFGTLAMHQVGGRHWDAWRRAMDKAIVQTQRKDTDHCQYKGSWDPIGPWGPDGGRVYATALLTMCCEVHYRYDRVFGTR